MPSLVYTCKGARDNECDKRLASSALVVSRKNRVFQQEHVLSGKLGVDLPP